jgi:hypothetical protein
MRSVRRRTRATFIGGPFSFTISFLHRDTIIIDMFDLTAADIALTGLEEPVMLPYTKDGVTWTSKNLSPES